MRIVFYEMKKLWSIKLLLIIAVLCALFYLMFMEFNVEHFPNGSPATEIFEYSIELTQRYGPTLEAHEYSEFIVKTRDELISEAETYIKNNPVFSGVGIYSYDDYEQLHARQDHTEEESDAIWTLLSAECNFVRFKIQALDSIEDNYNNYPEYQLPGLISEASTEKELARLNEIQETEEYRNIMDRGVLDNTATYTLYLAILAVLAVLVLVSPLIVTDRARNVNLLQYTAKHGRSILNKQLIAIILSAFLFTTVLIVIFGAIYSTNGTWPFLNNGLTSFLNGTLCLDLTYGQYVTVCIIMIYTLCLGAAAMAFILSRFSQNLITLILKLIPVFALLAAINTGVFNNTFNLSNILYKRTGIIGTEPIACALILIAGLALSLHTTHREKKADVV